MSHDSPWLQPIESTFPKGKTEGWFENQNSAAGCTKSGPFYTGCLPRIKMKHEAPEPRYSAGR